MEREEEMEEEMKEIIMKKLRITKNSKDLPSSSTNMRENRAQKSLKLFCFALLKIAPAQILCAHVLEACAQDEAAPSKAI